MGRSPCCDKVGVKKGPWTPEEDIVLVTYVQEHGPGNWRAVPTNTGLRRCSKSCRLRWSNYLRPGIKRGNFTEKEEKLIIHLQALLGNRWAAIASYLPERTDNDIKNYWNTHLRRKLSKQQFDGDGTSSGPCRSVEKGQWERRLQTDLHMAKQALREALSLEITPTFMSKNSLPSSALTAAASNSSPSAQSEDVRGHRCPHAPPSSSMSPYASHAENISRLLQGWASNYNDVRKPSGESSSLSTTQHSANTCDSSSGEDGGSFANDRAVRAQAIDSLLDFERRAVVAPSDGAASRCSFVKEESCRAPFSMLETWLLDDGAGQAGQECFMDDMALHSTAEFF